MALRIVSALEPMEIDYIVIGLFSLPGYGKTTLGFTADKPLLLDFDKGAHRAKNRKDTVPIDSWSDVADMTRDDLAPFSTIIIDTVGRALDYLAAEIIESNPKKFSTGGGLSLQGYGALKNRFTGWLKLMRTFGLDVVLIAHLDERSEGDQIKDRLDIQGGSRAEVYKVVDALGRLYLDGKDRLLDFSPREGSLGKNPAQMDILKVPSWQKSPTFLGDTIREIKASINSASAEQLEHRKLLADWEAKFAALPNREAFNRMLPEVATLAPDIKILLQQYATACGLVYDKASKQFEEKE